MDKTITPVWASVAILSVISIFHALIAWLNLDVGMFLYQSSRALAGDKLYVDLVQPSPPVIFLLKLPIVFISEMIGSNTIHMFKVSMILVIFGSIFLCVQIARKFFPEKSLPLIILFLVFSTLSKSSPKVSVNSISMFAPEGHLM